MLHDVKLRHYDRITKRETLEVVTVDAASGDEAAELAHSLRPQALVVGVAPKGGFGEAVGGATLEADEAEVPPDDEDAEPGPSNRELAAMRPRGLAAALGIPPAQTLADMQRAEIEAAIGVPPVKRGPGRPRKEPQ